MESPPPSDLDTVDLADALVSSWELDVRQVRYFPKGFGSFHWLAEAPAHTYVVTVDDLTAKPWLGSDVAAAYRNLEAAYDVACALRRHAGLGFVVAPIPRREGASTLRLSDRYALTVFPFMEGVPGVWGDPLDGAGRAELLGQLAVLHRATPAVAAGASRHDLVVPGRAGLEAALRDLDRPWAGGPFSERARLALAGRAGAVRQWLTAFDQLVDLVDAGGGERVITHGEPHPGNLIHTDHGAVLVDWDTVALAPPERDLWMFDDGSPGVLASYREASGREVNDDAISLFRLAWTLSEIAGFTALFRSDHVEDRDTERGWQVLRDALAGAPPAQPYGPSPADHV